MKNAGNLRKSYQQKTSEGLCRGVLRSSKPAFAILLALAALSLGAIAATAAALPAVGDAAPDFTLSSQQGTGVSLKEYRGQWVVLYFYPKDFTSGCTREAHDFQRDLPEYEKRKAVILGVSVDNVDSHKKFCTAGGLNFKLLADENHKVSQAYGSVMTYGDAQYAARNTFIIDPQGVIAKVFTSVDPAKHSAEVLAALDALQQQNGAHSR